MLSREQILRESAATGFQPEPLEKAVYLLELLELQAIIRSHPALLWKAMNVRSYFGARGEEKDVSPDPGNVKEG